MIVAPASTFGLDGWAAKLVLMAITFGATIVALGVIRVLGPRLARRVPTTSDPVKARQRQTAVALLGTMLRYVVLVAAVIATIAILAGAGGIGALGGSAVVAIIIGFASQRLLADVIAGFFILFEGQYGVGDLITVEPSSFTGVVDEVGVRTTVLRDANGDRCFIPNGQITAVRRLPSPRAALSITLLTRQPSVVEQALREVERMGGPTDGLIGTVKSVEHTEVGDGVVAVHARMGAAAAMSGAAGDLVAAALKARLGDDLIGDPVVTTVERKDGERAWPVASE